MSYNNYKVISAVILAIVIVALTAIAVVYEDIIQMVINEMYARYGYEFNNMSDIERKNVDFISE